LPSDFTRTFAIFFNKRNYVAEFESLLKKIKELPKYYSDMLGDLAFDAADYEKASKYYQEAYLLSESSEHLSKINKLIQTVSALNEERAKALGKRLLENLRVFEKGVKVEKSSA